MSNEPTVLIAHAADGSAYAERLSDELRKRGYPTQSASSLRTETGDILASVKVVLLVVTADSERVDALRNLIRQAQARERPILPLLCDGRGWASMADVQSTGCSAGRLPPEAFFQRIDEITRDAEVSLSEGAWALLQLGCYQAALQGFSQRVGTAPDDSNALVGRGFASCALGRYEDALLSFERVMRQQPDNLAAAAGSGEALLGLGEFQRALDTLGRVLKTEPQAARAGVAMSRTLLCLGRAQEALEILDRVVPAVELSPFDAWVIDRVGQLTHWSEVFHEGSMPIERFLLQPESMAEVERLRAGLLQRLGKRRQARRALIRARRLAMAQPEKQERKSGARVGAVLGIADPGVFISYSRDDRDYVRQLARHLKQRQLPVWFDDGIRAGDDWVTDIEKRLLAAPAVIVVASPSCLESKWVRRELLLADKLDIPIFPLLLRGDAIPLLLDLEHVNVSGGRLPDEGWVDGLRQTLRTQTVTVPSPAEPHYLAGLALIKLGRFHDALREFNRGITVDPEHSYCYVGRGSTLSQVAVLEIKPSEAGNPMLPWLTRCLEAYDRAVELDPTNADGHLGRAMILLNLGQVQEARIAAEAAVRADPDNADACSTRGAFLAQEGKFEEALADFEHALHLNPRHTNANQNRDYALQQLGRPGRQLTDVWIAAGLMEKPPLYGLRKAIQGMSHGFAGLLAQLLRKQPARPRR